MRILAECGAPKGIVANSGTVAGLRDSMAMNGGSMYLFQDEFFSCVGAQLLAVSTSEERQMLLSLLGCGAPAVTVHAKGIVTTLTNPHLHGFAYTQVTVSSIARECPGVRCL